MEYRGHNGTEQCKLEIAIKSMFLILFLLYLAPFKISWRVIEASCSVLSLCNPV
jgi:hypothetical protein